ncbi:MAG: CCA tRNA nucleotidyltransferase [Thaumarchaeota archaeon]|nr:CCA tRNA nucleotidyltransferase [Nitrososphaerota archaeon]
MTRPVSVAAKAEHIVTPSRTEMATIGSISRSILAKTERAAAKFPETRGVLLGGSFAKGTWLPRHVDLDIFVKFDPGTSEERFERAGLEIGKIATRGYPMGKMFAQHPYTEASIEGVRVNIVPCFDVKKGDWKSAVDRSPFHVELVEKLPESQKTQVRLLKSFMNAVGVYGAEIQRRGFSGYVAEVLVMKLGGLVQVLQWFSGYTPQEGRPFSLPDPVDEGRDLGIAVSGESLGKMVLASREFLRRPGLAFFHRMSGKAHPSLGEDVYAVLFTHKRLSEDTLWGELRKTSKHVVRHLEVQGFRVARSMAASDNQTRSAILLIPEFTEMPPTEQRAGPTVDRRKDVEAFLESNARNSRLVWVDDDARVRLLVPRRCIKLAELLTDVARGREGHIGASKELEAGMKKSASVLTGKSLLRAASSKRWLQDGIREITSDVIGTR